MIRQTYMWLFLLCVSPALAQETILRTDFSGSTHAENGVTLTGPNMTNELKALAFYSAIPTDTQFTDASDGRGLLIVARPGHGIMIQGQVIETVHPAMIRCNLYIIGAEADVAIAAANQDTQGFTSINSAEKTDYFTEKYKRVSTFFLPSSGAFQPYVEISNPSETDYLIAFVDNFDVCLLDQDKFYNGKYIFGTQDDPAITSIHASQIEPINGTPTPTPQITQPSTPSPTPTGMDNQFTFTPTYTVQPSPTATVTFTPSLIPTASYTPTPQFTPILTRIPTQTQTPEKTLTHTATPTNTPTPLFSPTSTKTYTPTRTPTPKQTLTPTATSSPSPSPTLTPEPTLPANAIRIRIPGLPDDARLMDMILIDPEPFVQGSPSNEQDRYPDETQHQVNLTNKYYIGMHEVTQAQWTSIMGYNLSNFNDDPNKPVENISWYECQDFIDSLNILGEGRFRLPTEAEWEYACRSGSADRFHWGRDPDTSKVDDYAFYMDNSENTSHPVGTKMPNAFGLFDMAGNVWEWCNDWYGDYPSQPQINPAGPDEGTYKVCRGGGWFSPHSECRSAVRYYYTPDTQGFDLGLRLVREYP